MNLFKWVDARHDVINDLAAIIMVAKSLNQTLHVDHPDAAGNFKQIRFHAEHIRDLLVELYNGRHEPFSDAALSLQERQAISKQIPYTRLKIPELLSSMTDHLDQAAKNEAQTNAHRLSAMLASRIEQVRQTIHSIENDAHEVFDLRDVLREFEEKKLQPSPQEITQTARVRKVGAKDAVKLQYPRLRQPIMMYGSRVWMHRILENAWNNAKEANAQTVRIDVARVTDTESNDKTPHVQLRISNDGDELPRAVWEKMFERGMTHGKSKGTGLGMDIIKGAVERWPVPEQARPAWTNQVYVRRFNKGENPHSVRLIIKLPLHSIPPSKVIGRRPTRRGVRASKRVMKNV